MDTFHAVVVNLSKLKLRQDITIISWSWILSKSYAVSGDKYGPFAKCNDKKKYRIVKRIYKFIDYDDLSKFIITRYNPNKKATGRNINVFSEAEYLVIVAYEFSNGAKEIYLLVEKIEYTQALGKS